MDDDVETAIDAATEELEFLEQLLEKLEFRKAGGEEE